MSEVHAGGQGAGGAFVLRTFSAIAEGQGVGTGAQTMLELDGRLAKCSGGAPEVRRMQRSITRIYKELASIEADCPAQSFKTWSRDRPCTSCAFL